MALTPEWRRRIELWRDALPRLFYRELCEVPLEGFVTHEQLTPAQAADGDFASMPSGTPWGAKWEYAWFRGAVSVPDEAAGERVVLCPEPGGESVIWLDGRAAGARDAMHSHITLTRSAEPGTEFSFLLEAYGGHGRMWCGQGPVIDGEETVPEPPATQTNVGRSTLGVWDEAVYQLWLDVVTLLELRDHIGADSLRVAEIDAGLRDFTLVCDVELPRRELLPAVEAARERLRPLLECVNGSTAPEMFAVGHAHIDVAWLWPHAETERKTARTFSTQLAMMDDYPEYRFLQSQAHLYDVVRRRYPALYERVREAARDGRFVPEGGMWVEADTNITGGESLIRQFVHGKRFFREEFGYDCEMLWLPDVFGYSGALPQIMAGCGIKYFSTAKIFWNYHGGDPFPHNTFDWQGIDGTRTLVHLCKNYNATTNPSEVIRRWNSRVQKDNIRARLYPFGYGDGGGGVTRDHLEFLRRMADLEGAPRMKIASPIDYFREIETDGLPKAVYVGELYYQCHRGTYTSQAKTKRGNRRCELALREAEMWSALAAALNGHTVPTDELDAAWKTVLVNQFHDILPGSSIARVYAEAEAQYARVEAEADRIATEAAASFAKAQDDAATVFNSLSWKREALIELPKGFSGAALPDGSPLAAQKIDGAVYAEAPVPSCGWTTLHAAEPSSDGDAVVARPDRLENDVLRVEFNASGEIVSLYDKETDREFAAGPCNEFRMYRDVPSAFDAWDIDSMYELCPVDLAPEAAIDVVSAGPLAGVLRITRTLNNSTLTQEVWLRRGARTVEFRTVIDWQEKHRLLKVAFPAAIHSTEAIHEIQFGHIRRPSHKSRPFDADRFEVAQHKWTAVAEEGRGLAVLNDCKYGVNTRGGEIALTLLKSAQAPDMHADLGRQEFTYAVHVWTGGFAASGVVRAAYELNVPVRTVPGTAGRARTFSVDAPNVIIETVKPAEDGSGDVVLRLYESGRTATRCTLRTSLPARAAALTDMLEENPVEVGVDNEEHVALDFRPFEIKTLRLSLS